MDTVFSHIVQKLLPEKYENVATEALDFILRNERARSGLMRLLRGTALGLPLDLRFDTQNSFDTPQAEGKARPDMWGFEGATPRVFIENKFDAGLTENQPVEYLRELAVYLNPAVLLMVVPHDRVATVWRVCMSRLRDAPAKLFDQEHLPSVDEAVAVELVPAAACKPIFAITSWTKLLNAIEAELTDEPHIRNDLHQLRALCVAAEAEYLPFSETELTKQRTPAMILRLNKIVEAAVEKGIGEGFLRRGGLTTGYGMDRHGFYRIFTNGGTIAWFGTDFRLWRTGLTPLWLTFENDTNGRALDVRLHVEAWARGKGITCSVKENGAFAVGISVVAGEDESHVIMAIVDQLRAVATQLSSLPPKREVTR
ncbi:MAG: hypothetical protein EXR78_09860 [Deltaproteobacteria bacterium]|nr:hypothetical protein [Deltaproteobacteria bacterium]